MRKIYHLIIVVPFLLSACQPVQSQTPTLAPTSTSLPVSTPTSTPLPAATPTATATSSPAPTTTPTPLPGLGVNPDAVIGTLDDFFTFSQSGEQDGQPLQKGVSKSGFSTITLAGEPYLTQAELVIDLSKEESISATAYWILFLEYTAHGGEAAAVWVRDHFNEAAKNGQAGQTFGSARVTLLVSGANNQIFTLNVAPDNQ